MPAGAHPSTAADRKQKVERKGVVHEGEQGLEKREKKEELNVSF